MKFIHSLSAKYLFVSTLILAFFTLLLSATFQLTRQAQGESRKMNLAGRQRMELLHLTSHLHFLTGAFSEVEADLHRSDIDAIKKKYQAVLYGLRDGDESLNLEAIHPHDHTSRVILAGLIDRWEASQKPLLQTIADAPLTVRRSSCAACHEAFLSHIQDLDTLATSLDTHYKSEMERFKLIRLYLLIFFCLMAMGIGVYVHRHLIKPIREMRDAADRIKQKDFTIQLPVTGQDEISSLALDFNEMAATLATLFREKDETTQRLSMLHQVGKAAGRTLRLDALLNNLLDEIFSLELFSLQKKGAIFLYDNEKKILNLGACRDYGPEQLKNCSSVPVGECLCGLAAEHKTVVQTTTSTDHRHTLTYEGMSEHGHIILPLMLGGQLLGILCIYLPVGRVLSAGEEDSLRSVADIIAVALQNSLTHRQAATLAQALDSSHDLIVIADPQGAIMHANPIVVDYFGYQPHEMIGRHVFTTHSPSNPAGLDQEIFSRTLAGGWDGELFFSRRDGSEYPVFLATAPVRDEQGEVVALLGIARDITLQKQMEDEFKMSEERLRRAQRIGHVGCWEWQVKGDVLFWSEEVYHIFGRDPQSFTVSYEGLLGCIPPDDRQRVKEGVEAVLRTGRKYDIDHRILLPDGSEKIVHESAEVTYDSDGSPRLMTGTIHDITEHKKLEETIIRANQELGRQVAERTADLEEAKRAAEAANRTKSEFLANMSHELRTPLNSILGFVDIIRDGMAGPTTDSQREYLGDVMDSSRHLLSLINDILDLSKVEAGHAELELSTVAVADLVERSLVLFKEKAMKHSITLAVDLADDIGEIRADERKIKQVLVNLLANAMKFTPDGGRVAVMAARGDDGIRITVQDTGIGIAREDLPKLFQPFQQLETELAKKYPGTGLGLSLCRKFVELHGGRIWVKSELGAGSSFIFVLPEEPGPTLAQLPGENGMGENSVLAGTKILAWHAGRQHLNRLFSLGCREGLAIALLRFQFAGTVSWDDFQAAAITLQQMIREHDLIMADVNQQCIWLAVMGMDRNISTETLSRFRELPGGARVPFDMAAAFFPDDGKTFDDLVAALEAQRSSGPRRDKTG